MSYILALDQGTTNSKALILNENMDIIKKASIGYNLDYPQHGFVEVNANTILTTMEQAIKEVVPSFESDIVGIGISNQRETVVVWDKTTLKPLYPALIWQDTRANDICECYKNHPKASEIINKTGIDFSPMFPVFKIKWIINELKKQNIDLNNIQVGTVDSWLLKNITTDSQHYTDMTNASRFQLLNLKNLEFDEDLCSIFDINKNLLPTIKQSVDNYGISNGNLGIPKAVPICALIGDSHASLFGHSIDKENVIKATYGTGTSLMMPTLKLSEKIKGITNTVANAIGNEVIYALEGNISASGALISYVSSLLGVENVNLMEKLSLKEHSSGGVHIIPALAGLGAPYWNSQATGQITGLTFATNNSHIAYATFETVAFQIKAILNFLSKNNKITEFRFYVDGGATVNKTLMQIQANILQSDIFVNPESNLSGLGAGLLAGLGANIWNKEDIKQKQLKRKLIKYTPNISYEQANRQFTNWENQLLKSIS